MKLSQILSQVKTEYEIIGDLSRLDAIEVEDVTNDSRLVKKNSVFFALSGKQKDGWEFINDAVKSGAAAIVASKEAPGDGYILLKSHEPSQLLAEFLNIFYKPLPANIYAVTGTNGKTSVAEFTRQILQFLGKKSASIGTLGTICEATANKGSEVSSLTTPDIVSLYKNLQTLKQNGVDDVVMEVSSIGLDQGRIADLKIDVAAFTNFTQDHLDYHKSMQDYFASKMLLFKRALKEQGLAVLNSDITEFAEIKKICEEKKHRIIEYGLNAKDLNLKKLEPHGLGQKVFFEKDGKEYHFDLEISGEFQAYNALCALGNVLAKNNLNPIELTNLLKNFSRLRSAPGRMQRVATLKNGAQIFIDFAHSPDALKNVLKLVRKITKGRVIVLFGCGGNRDAKKRPIMGRVACDLADLVIVTDDNPRLEKAADIRHEIISACDMGKTVEIADRRAAINKAIEMLKSGDTLILAGKGHEKYQIIGDKKFEFDEELVVKNVISKSS